MWARRGAVCPSYPQAGRLGQAGPAIGWPVAAGWPGETFKSGEKVEAADVIDTDMEFLYSDGGDWHFMDPNTYEQYSAAKAALGGHEKWLLQGMTCGVTLYNDAILLIHPPHFVDLKVVETEPGIRGDTATGGSKNATLETGAVVRVPLFIEVDETLRLDTRTGEYVSRVKN